MAITGAPYSYTYDDPANYYDPTGLFLGIPGTPTDSEVGRAISETFSDPYRDAEYAAAGACVVASAGVCVAAVTGAFAANTYNNATQSSSLTEFAEREGFTVLETTVAGAPTLVVAIPEAAGTFEYVTADGETISQLPNSFLGRVALNLPPGVTAATITALESNAEKVLDCGK